MSIPTSTLLGQIIAPAPTDVRFQGPRPMAADAPVSTLIGRILSGPAAPARAVPELITVLPST